METNKWSAGEASAAESLQINDLRLTFLAAPRSDRCSERRVKLFPCAGSGGAGAALGAASSKAAREQSTGRAGKRAIEPASQPTEGATVAAAP